ncbi:MAG: hypothetical protein R3F39_02290 [Myxococcota bacterium]
MPRSLKRCVLAAALASLAWWPAAGCDELNQMFTGLWRATSVEADGLFEGSPELAIGHFGREVAGVAYFKIVQGGSQYVAECPCAFINHEQLDLDARTVRFSTTCDGSLVLDWRLKLTSEGARRFLEGEVTRADGGPGTAVVRLERAEESVRDEEKQCPPAAP